MTALLGIRVLDLGRVLAAPWATQILGDFGAEIIKVERPDGGDMGRQYGPDFLIDAEGNRTRESSFYLCANRNKRSLTVDLSKEQGREIIRELARRSDVLVENFIPGTMERFELDYARLSKLNPGLIYCSVTGYGQTGPLRERPGFDAVFQAHAGMMSITGVPDGKPGAGPMKTGPSLMDIMTGYNAAIGILTALMHRERNGGAGQYIDVALLDTAIAAQSHVMSNYLISGRLPTRRGNEGNGGGPAQVFECTDGHIYISAGNNHHFHQLCAVLGDAELAHDERFLDLGRRFLNRAALTARLNELVAPWGKFALLDALVAAGVPCSVVNNYEEVFADPQVVERGIRVEMAHPLAAGGVTQVVANPVRLSETPPSYEMHPPLLGEHSEAILSGLLGYTAAQIEDLRRQGVI